MKSKPCCLPAFRSLARHAWPLHALLFAGLILLPCSGAFGAVITVYQGSEPYYDFDDVNESGVLDGDEVANYYSHWMTAYSALGTEAGQFNDADWSWSVNGTEVVQYFNNDTDSLLDWEEVDLTGSLVNNPDSDADGIFDDDEWLLAKPLIEGLPENAYSLSLTDWDSNNDNISDFDAYYLALNPGSTYQPPVYAGGVLPSSFPNAKFFDYDGDGADNPSDPYPTDPLNNDADQDTIPDYTFNGGSAVAYDPVLHNPVQSPADQLNVSPHNLGHPGYDNTGKWYNNAMGDLDGDGVKNWYDIYPTQGINNDSDGDLIVDFIDSVQNDPELLNPENPQTHAPPTGLIHWRMNALGNEDGDGTLNWYDTHPYDPWDGQGSANDDNDAFVNSLDPARYDSTNTSSTNGTAWYSSALEDSDGDTIKNFFDEFPYDFYNGNPDFDGDGFENGIDPYPTDTTNKSLVNLVPYQVSWHSAALDDADNDGTANWCDAYPYDEFNGDSNVDYDDFLNPTFDGAPDPVDPAPRDSSNTSTANGIVWYGLALGDADGDGVKNFFDGYPYPASQVDTDGDGYYDDLDPFINDNTNYSSVNGTAWYGSVFSDPDGDGQPNHADTHPDDEWNADSDVDDDGLENMSDPVPRSFANYSPHNGQNWPSTSATGNIDGDYLPNWTDPQPTIAYVDPDRDQDGILNASDPFPDDATNYSSVNQTAWYGNVLGNDDGDAALNHADAWPSDPHDGQDGIDGDIDGLSLWLENQYGTSDSDPDCDDDTLTDFEELVTYGSGPLDRFSVSRGLGWGELYEDADLVDTADGDGDGIPNLVEQHYPAMNYQDPSDGAGDLDANGLTNRQQYDRGMALDAGLADYDADGDGMSNLWEEYFYFDKHNAMDATGDADGDHVLNWEEQALRLSPHNSDTIGDDAYPSDKYVLLALIVPSSLRSNTNDADSNSIPDWLDEAMLLPEYSPSPPSDWDGDGMPDWWEHKYGTRTFPNGLNLRQPDAGGDNEVGGGDGLTNFQEYQLSTHPMISDSDGNGISDLYEDWDGDGLNSLHELAAGTNARLWDSDGDGISDAQEIAEGSDPLSSSSNSAAAIGLRVFTPLPPLPGNAL